MRRLSLLLWFLAVAGIAAAEDRDWQAGTWGTAATVKSPPAAAARGAARVQTYAIETDAARLDVQETVPPARSALVVKVGAPVKFVVERTTVYVLDVSGVEHTLRLTKTTPKPGAAKSPAAPAYSGFGGGHFIRAVGEGGRSLTLEDGSVWDIDPRGWYLTVEWQPRAGIAVRRAKEENGFAYDLTNLDADEGVLAKYVAP